MKRLRESSKFNKRRWESNKLYKRRMLFIYRDITGRMSMKKWKGGKGKLLERLISIERKPENNLKSKAPQQSRELTSIKSLSRNYDKNGSSIVRKNSLRRGRKNFQKRLRSFRSITGDRKWKGRNVNRERRSESRIFRRKRKRELEERKVLCSFRSITGDRKWKGRNVNSER